jgi:hypothetical protein
MKIRKAQANQKATGMGGYDCLMMLMTRQGVTTEEKNRIVA